MEISGRKGSLVQIELEASESTCPTVSDSDVTSDTGIVHSENFGKISDPNPEDCDQFEGLPETGHSPRDEDAKSYPKNFCYVRCFIPGNSDLSSFLLNFGICAKNCCWQLRAPWMWTS